MDWAYLDNNATTRPLPEVVEAVDQASRELWANPSSVHRMGQQVRQRIELARQSVAGLIGAAERELIFTSGGTESDNLALFGVAPLDKLTLITTKVEHAAVREPAQRIEKRGGAVAYAGVDADGAVQLDSISALSEQHSTPGRTTLVSIQWANNETGVIQPVGAIAQALQARRDQAADAGQRIKLLLHLDATQAVGKLPVDVAQAGCDLLTLAAHKFHGPKGVGALWARRGVRLQPTHLGGAQERDRRGGTENTPGIIGLGVAAAHAKAFVQDPDAIERVRALRDQLEQGICQALPSTVVNSDGADRLWNTTNLGFPGIEAEAVLLGLSEQGVCASAGAACSSGSLDPSPVLLAMGIPEPVAHGSVRFSLSRMTTPADIERALEVVPKVVGRLMKTLPTG
ncbi:MAG: cysteine desulfurase [Phycisphaeraceae bacterium]|nr:cysteine desulfurase [Phycisphaeraceae bacterium]